jgi:hypothetical protein
MRPGSTKRRPRGAKWLVAKNFNFLQKGLASAREESVAVWAGAVEPRRET